MRRKVMLTALVIACWLAAIPPAMTHAQPASTPLLLEINGDLWEWGGIGQPFKQLTHCAANEECSPADNPILSPDGRHIAYTTVPSQLVKYLISINWAVAGLTPSANVWTLDLATGIATRIADQPPGYDPKKDMGILRSNPVWSPDSKFLAWTEIANIGSSSVEQLMVYDLSQKYTQVVSRGAPLDYPAQPIWSDGGLAVFLTDPDTGFLIRTFDANGKALSKVPTNEQENADLLRWVKDGNREYIRIGRLDPNKYPSPTFIDPITGQQTPRLDPIELYSLAVPDGLSMFWAGGCYPDLTGCPWLINVPRQATVRIDTIFDVGPYTSNGLNEPNSYIAIAPDGQRVAYLKHQSGQDDSPYELWMYQNGQTQMVALPKTGGQIEALTWGAMGWRIRHGLGYGPDF